MLFTFFVMEQISFSEKGYSRPALIRYEMRLWQLENIFICKNKCKWRALKQYVLNQFISLLKGNYKPLDQKDHVITTAQYMVTYYEIKDPVNVR